jgi:hypothetical protein
MQQTPDPDESVSSERAPRCQDVLDLLWPPEFESALERPSRRAERLTENANGLDRLVAELAEPFQAAREGRLHRRRGDRDRHRWPGAGHPETLTLRDRLLCTLAWLRLALPHQALALLYGVDRSTVSSAVRQIRPLLAGRGFATPQGQRLHTLADVLAYAAAEGLTVRLDGTEIQIRRPKANRPGRRAFVSGKKRQNIIKATVASDAHGRPLWAGAIRPGRQHDQTAVRTEGINDLLDAYPR